MNFDEPLTSNTQLNAGNLQVQFSTFGGGLLFISSVAFNISEANQVPSDDPDFALQNNQLNLARNVAAGIFGAPTALNVLAQTCPVVSISREDNSGGLDPRTTSDEATNFSGNIFGDDFFEQVDYRGAFGPNVEDFWAGWTYVAKRNIFAAELQNN